MLGIIVREMENNDIEGKAYVHYKSWHETYTGIISDKYMEKVTYEKCLDITISIRKIQLLQLWMIKL